MPKNKENSTPPPPTAENDSDEWDAFKDQPDTDIFEATEMLDESSDAGGTEVGMPAADSTDEGVEMPDTSNPKLSDSDLEFLKNNK